MSQPLLGQFHSLNWYVLNGSGFFNPTATGGTIGTGGNINVTFDGNASTTGTSTTGSISAQIQNGNGGSIETGGNISMTVGGNLTAGPLFLITENEGGHIGTGGNNTLQVSGDITTQDDAGFYILNNDNGNGPGTIDSNATINVSAANICSGGSLFDNIHNQTGGHIGGNANLNFNLTGDLTTQDNASFVIDNNNSGLIGSDATINVAASSISVGGGLDADIFSPGGNIGGNALLSVAISDDMATQGDVTFSIFNNDQGSGAGTIGSDVMVSVSAAGISANSLVAQIDNSIGGNIGGSANLTFTLTGDPGNLTTQGDALFQIQNNDGGQIMGNGTIDVTAASISNQGNLFLTIFNQLGSIGGDAAIRLSLSGDIVSQHDANFWIWNFGGKGPPAGTINGDALINVAAVNLTAANGGILTGQILNQNVGFIGGNATMDFDFSGDINAGGVDLIIDNIGGMIGQDARISVTATNISVGGNLDVTIDNSANGGTIGGSANLTFNLTGNLAAQGEANFQILNNDAGQIGGNGNISVTTGGDLTANSIDALINNRNGGSIASAANMNFDIGGALRYYRRCNLCRFESE